MVNIFFINSPFQLLCSIEAISEFKTNNNVVVIFNKGKGKTLKQIRTLLSDYESKFNNIEFIDRELESILGWFDGFRYMDGLINKYPKVNNIFIGDYRSGLVRHFSNSVE